jgi:hypothetical protein
MPIGELNKVNLSSVVAATDGEAIDTRHLDKKTVYVEVSGNTGSVKVTIQHSPDKLVWFDLDAKTYAGVNREDSWSYDSHFSYMRTRTTAHANATVKTTVVGVNRSGS